MTERSVAQVHSVVYKLRGKQWDVQTKDWAQLHLYRDDRDGTYRIVGWSVTTSAVVLNANVSPLCVYKRKSDDFHKFTDEDKVVWGFGFYMQPESIAEANRFLSAMETALQQPADGKALSPTSPSSAPSAGPLTSPGSMVRQLSSPGPPNMPPTHAPGPQRAQTFRTMPAPHEGQPHQQSPSSAPTAQRRHSLSQQGVVLPAPAVPAMPSNPPPGPRPPLPQSSPPPVPSMSMSPVSPQGTPPVYTPTSTPVFSPLGVPPPSEHQSVFVNGAVPLGILPILPPKQKRRAAAPISNGPSVSDPERVEHKQHVKYDKENRRFVGLPEEWQEALSKQFGIPLALVDKVRLPGYAHGIPAILLQLRDLMYSAGGLNQEGIFRLAPDAEMCAQVKKQLDNGTFQGCTDPNILANLIKVWFRDLPRHLLADVPVEAIQNCGDSLTNAAAIVEAMPEPAKSVYLWLLDMCAQVAANSAVNKMPPQNLAICIAPNLFAPIAGDPMASLMFSQKVANFVTQSIKWRMEQNAAGA